MTAAGGPDDEPLLGCELIRIHLETYSIEFEFSGWTLAVGGRFQLARPAQRTLEFFPPDHEGDLTALWHLIAEKIEAVLWPANPADNGEIRIRLSSGSEIIIPPGDFPRGTLHGHQLHPSGGLIIEDF